MITIPIWLFLFLLLGAGAGAILLFLAWFSKWGFEEYNHGW